MSAATTNTSNSKKRSRINLLLSAIIALCVAIAGYVVFVTFASPTTSLYMQPSGGTYKAGDTIVVTIRTNTGGESVNAVQANFSYSADYLQFQSIDSGGSAFGIGASENGSNGSVSIARGSISSLNGSDLLVSKVTFKALSKSGSANLGFTSGSAVVRSSDSQNVLSVTNGASYTIQVPTTSTPTPTPTPTPKPSPTPTSPSPTEPSNDSGEQPAPTAPTNNGGSPTNPDAGIPNDQEVVTDGELPVANQDKEPFEEPSYFFGLSNQTVLAAGVGIPLAIAALAGAFIYLRWRGSARILQSGHNFKATTFTAQDTPALDVKPTMVQPEAITPITPSPDLVHVETPAPTPAGQSPSVIQPSVHISDQPLQADVTVEENIITPSEPSVFAPTYNHEDVIIEPTAQDVDSDSENKEPK